VKPREHGRRLEMERRRGSGQQGRSRAAGAGEPLEHERESPLARCRCGVNGLAQGGVLKVGSSRRGSQSRHAGLTPDYR
jgi:hypothetical protein